MAHKTNWLVADQLVEITFSGDIETNDLMFLHHLDLPGRTRPVYVLIGYDHVKVVVPQDSLSVLGNTQATHPMVGHIAVCEAPAMMEIFGKMLVKVGRLKDRVSFHPTRDQALAKLQALIAQS